MKLLLDSCVWGGVKKQLADAGHDVVWAGDWDKDPGDDEILSYSYAELRILVTLDKDFGELAIVRKHPHHGIIRLVNFSARAQAIACVNVLNAHGKDLENGAIVTAEPGRMRYRAKEES
jgi:predicted nuclease of predicted toxin-antitoxin system